MSCHQFFDLPQRPPLRDFEPGSLVVGSCHSSELARRRPADAAITKRLSHLGQALECLGHAKTFFGPPRFVSEESFDVLREATESEVQVDT
jgi:hypothetical protein